jgi:hypothetical protein
LGGAWTRAVSRGPARKMKKLIGTPAGEIELRDKVKAIYRKAAQNPEGKFHFAPGEATRREAPLFGRNSSSLRTAPARSLLHSARHRTRHGGGSKRDRLGSARWPGNGPRDDHRRRESEDVPGPPGQGERSALAIPSARCENGRGRPLSLLLLLPLPALLRHGGRDRHNDYFRARKAPYPARAPSWNR